MSLKAAWDSTNASAPALIYNFKAGGKPTKVMIDFMPTFRLYPRMQLRVSIGVDNKWTATLQVPGSDGKEDEGGPNRNQGVRNNYVRATVDLPELTAGSHKLFIRAVEPELVIDRISFLN